MNTLYGPPQRKPPALRLVPDLAGLPVHDVVGQPIGTVFGSLAEAASGLIRYLDVELSSSPRHVLVPTGHMRIEERDRTRRARLLVASRDELEQIPPYRDGRELSDEYQRSLLAAFSGLFYGERYYAHPAYDHSGLYAGDHEVIGATPATGGAAAGPADGRAAPERRSAGAGTDVTGWPLLAADGTNAGEVSDIVTGPGERRIRYLAVSSGDSTRLLPVGFATADRSGRCVRAPALAADDIRGLPAYEGPPLTREFEDELRAAIGRRVAPERRFLAPDFRGGPEQRGAARS